MKKLRYFSIVLFNIICGCLFVFVIAPWIMTYIYMAEAFGIILDPTLYEGLFLVFLFIAIAVSITYFPILIFGNIYLNKKLQMGRKYFIILISIVFIVSFFLTGLALYSLK